MRVAIGGIWHETNTFAAPTTPLASFEVREGAALVETFQGTRTPLGGFLQAASFEIVPTLYASTTPSGTVARDAYDNLAGRLTAQLADARPDGILLDLHGAMVVEGIEEVEADLIARIRGRLGKIPIGAVLDFHANISASFVERIDVLAGYMTYPHVDPCDRGVEVADLLARMLAGKIRPSRAIVQPPLLIAPQAQRTDVSPFRDVMEAARARGTLLNATVAGGFAYADVPHAGLSVVVTTDGDPDAALAAAAEIARAAWNRRDLFRVVNATPEEAVARALREPEGPVILVDQADNIGGGAPGDGTAILRELLRAGARGAVVSITDPRAVAEARRAGEGNMIAVDVGVEPVRLQARVVKIGCGDFTYRGSYMTNRRVTAGAAAVLDAGGVLVVVRERKVMPFDRAEIEVMGIDPRRCRIIVVKSALAWRAAYGDLARAVIEVDAPGICTARLETLPYRRVRRPVEPLDPGTPWMCLAKSRALYERSRKVLPGGVSSNIRARWKPFPLFYSHGKGSRLWDVDGNEYIDYVLARGPLLLGHSPAPVIEAVKHQLDRGLMYAGQHELEIEVAEKISRRVPCAERVRFSNSGSEAVHMALRLARACTGRQKHVRFEGHYHGWFDNVFYSYAPRIEEAGPRESPRPVPGSRGLSPGDAQNIIVLPWNDLGLVEKILREHGPEIAALITEPVMCNTGGILPKPGYLQGLRDLCSRHGVVLIFDEVITGFRLAPGGAQEHFGVTPDLATFAKAVAGGFCVSVLAGKAALMDEIGALTTVHAGTYNSNPPCMAACRAALEMLDADVYRAIRARGEALMAGIAERASRAGKPASVRGLPPCFHVSFGETGEVADYRSYSRRDAAAQERFWEALQARGIRTVPEGAWFVSAAHTDEDVERTLEAVTQALEVV